MHFFNALVFFMRMLSKQHASEYVICRQMLAKKSKLI